MVNGSAELEEQNREFLQICQYYAGAFAEGEYMVQGNVALAYCGVRNLTFNTAALVEQVSSEEQLQSSVRTAASYFDSKQADWAFLVCDAYVPASVRDSVPVLFARSRMEWFWGVTGMVCSEVAAPTRMLPTLDYRTVDTDQTRNTVVEINARAYGVEREWFSEVILNPRLWTDRHRAYIGYAGGRPVVTVAIDRGNSAVGVYWVATEPDAQGAGYAEAAVRYALEEARTAWGLERSILQASDRGLPLYARMGFRPVTRFDYYTDED